MKDLSLVCFPQVSSILAIPGPFTENLHLSIGSLVWLSPGEVGGWRKYRWWQDAGKDS